MRIDQSVTVRRPAPSVFRWIADPALAARWQLGVLEYEVLDQTPDLVGTTYREVVGDDRGSVELRGEVVEHVPGEVLGFLVTGRGLRVHSRYVVSPVAGGALVEVEADVRIGGVLSPLTTPFARRKAVRQLRVELDRLKEHCEAEPTPGG